MQAMYVHMCRELPLASLHTAANVQLIFVIICKMQKLYRNQCIVHVACVGPRNGAIRVGSLTQQGEGHASRTVWHILHVVGPIVSLACDSLAVVLV
jgi:hypothetical protein